MDRALERLVRRRLTGRRRSAVAMSLVMAAQLAFAAPIAAADSTSCSNNYPVGVAFGG